MKRSKLGSMDNNHFLHDEVHLGLLRMNKQKYRKNLFALEYFHNSRQMLIVWLCLLFHLHQGKGKQQECKIQQIFHHEMDLFLGLQFNEKSFMKRRSVFPMDSIKSIESWWSWIFFDSWGHNFGSPERRSQIPCDLVESLLCSWLRITEFEESVFENLNEGAITVSRSIGSGE